MIFGSTSWQSLSPWLDRVLEIPPAERAAWLAELRRDDPVLASDLEALLEEGTQLARDGFMDRPVHMPMTSLSGQTLGAWILESPIGQGGAGSVWLAHRGDGRFEGKAAIKILNMALMSRTGEERFRREGSILARLDHPNIARLLDAGISSTGQPYLVLDYVAGERIDVYCDSQRLDVPARLRVFLDVLAAVGDAHANLIVHRDIKPSNVMVTGDGVVKLLDFGIAKLLDEEAMSGEATQLTRDGGRALTPEFAAPEQLLGGTVTTATDVYALGVVLYLLLGGRHPAGENTRSTIHLTKAIVDIETPRLSESVLAAKSCSAEILTDNAAKRASSPAKLRHLLQGDLDNIVAKALKKHPKERYPSVTAFAEDLRRYLHDEPVSARSDSIAYRTAKFVKRHRVAVTAGTLALMAIIAGLVGTITQAHRAADQARQAQHQRDLALRDLTYAEAADEFMRFLLSESSDKPFTTLELLARAEQLVDKQFAGNAELRARLQLTVADLYGEVIDFKRAEAVLLQAQKSSRAGSDAALGAQIDCTLAGLYSAVGEPDRSPGLLDGAIARLRSASEPQSAALADCLNERAIQYRDRGDAKAALGDAQDALHYLGVPRPGQRAMAADLRTSLADTYGMLGDYPQAIRSYEQALDEFADMGRGHTSAALTLANNLGVHLSRAGQLLQSASVYQRALDGAPAAEAVTRHLLGTNYAKVLLELGRTQQALRLFEDALLSANRSGNARAIAFTSLYAASAWCAQGDLTRCSDLLAGSREKLHAVLPADHYVFGIVETTAAKLALARHDPVAAQDDLRHAVKIFDAATEKSPARIRALSLLARTEQELAEDNAARDDAAEAVSSAREASTGFTHSEWLGSALLAMGVVQSAQGNNAAAQTTLRESLAQLHESVGDDAPATREARALLAGLDVPQGRPP
jgi:serine/threonine protein kinase/tetratricopeptide (TPR) repeat protein